MTTARAQHAAGVGAAAAVVCAAAVVWAWVWHSGGEAGRFPAVPAALATFLVVQVAVPRVRWDRDRVLGPGNIALLLFALQLVVVPTLLVTLGPTHGALLALPPDRYINGALLLQALGYACYGAGYLMCNRPVRPQRLLPPPGATSATAAALLAIGAIGLALKFPSIGALRDYFTGQGDVFAVAGSSTLAEAASSFLRPFLSYGLIVVWAARIVRRPPGQRLSPAELGLAVLAVAAAATYGYNRASVVVPIFALITAYSCCARRLPLARITAVLVLLAVLGFQFGQYRADYTGTQGGRISATDAGLTGPKDTVADTVQVYANGPQFWAAVLQDVDRSGVRGGATLLGSALLPVPVLGKPFRADSGPAAYNELLYGRSDVADQILAFGAEFYWNFGLLGLAAGYVLLGLAIRRCDDRVRGAIDPLAAYSWSFCGAWAALLVINSISVLAQIAVYFFWPVVAMTVITRLTPHRPTEVNT